MTATLSGGSQRKGHNMKKRILCALLSLGLCLTPALAAGAEKFPAVNAYSGYADVRESDWYYSSAKLCAEMGLMNGTDRGFEPTKTLSVAECAALAARLLEGYTGKPIPANAQGAAWYQNYMDYLGQYVDTRTRSIYGMLPWDEPDRPATRWEFALFLSLVMDGNESAFPALNSVSEGDLPDVKDDAVVLSLYNAGILKGTDDAGTFQGSKTLTRAEAAAMVTRMARSGERLIFTLKPAQSQPKTGDMAAFVDQYLGGKANATYFYYGGKAASAGDFLTAALTTADGLSDLCAQQGAAFAWGNALDAGEQGQTSFLIYVYTLANTAALDSAADADPQAVYAAWQSQTYKAKHILVTEETGGKNTADMLYEVLKNDPGQFDPLLTIYGEDPGMAANPGGYLFGPGEMVAEFEEGTKALQPGQISQPIQSSYGWHIIQRLPLTQADYESDTGRLLFTADFADGIDVTDAYAAWLTYKN